MCRFAYFKCANESSDVQICKCADFRCVNIPMPVFLNNLYVISISLIYIFIILFICTFEICTSAYQLNNLFNLVIIAIA